MTNCKNCGAPLHGSRCEYCGTEYPVNVVYDNKVSVNVTGLAFATTTELVTSINGALGYIRNADGSYSDISEGIENCPCIM